MPVAAVSNIRHSIVLDQVKFYSGIQRVTRRVTYDLYPYSYFKKR